MHFLRSLFIRTPRRRQFARLDQQGHCQAFKQCGLPPVGDGWVEVDEIRLSWMHRPLPASARLSPRLSHPQPRQALAS